MSIIGAYVQQRVWNIDQDHLSSSIRLIDRNRVCREANQWQNNSNQQVHQSNRTAQSEHRIWIIRIAGAKIFGANFLQTVGRSMLCTCLHGQMNFLGKTLKVPWNQLKLDTTVSLDLLEEKIDIPALNWQVNCASFSGLKIKFQSSPNIWLTCLCLCDMFYSFNDEIAKQVPICTFKLSTSENATKLLRFQTFETIEKTFLKKKKKFPNQSLSIHASARLLSGRTHKKKEH
jgi:hypothetical protein